MATERLKPYEVDEIVRLIPQDPDAPRCNLTLPNGMPITMDAEWGFVNVQLFMAGKWTWNWGAGDAGELDVVDNRTPEQLAQAGSTAPLPTASLSSRPA